MTHHTSVSVRFQNFEKKRATMEVIDIDDFPMEEELPEEDYDDLDEYSFSKFASMSFQGAATATHIRQRLRQPLLYHEEAEDITVLPFDYFKVNVSVILLFLFH